MNLSEKIMMLRKKEGWSQEELANHLQISRQAVSKWETNQSEPSMKNLIELAELFQISLSELTDTKDSHIPIINQHVKCSYCGKEARYILDQTKTQA